VKVVGLSSFTSYAADAMPQALLIGLLAALQLAIVGLAYAAPEDDAEQSREALLAKIRQLEHVIPAQLEELAHAVPETKVSLLWREYSDWKIATETECARQQHMTSDQLKGLKCMLRSLEQRFDEMELQIQQAFGESPS
jgi:hypothetical protein